MAKGNNEALADELLAFPSADRARLAAMLLASLEGRGQDAAPAWDREIDQRAGELDGGQVSGVPTADVFAEVERRLRR